MEEVYLRVQPWPSSLDSLGVTNIEYTHSIHVDSMNENNLWWNTSWDTDLLWFFYLQMTLYHKHLLSACCCFSCVQLCATPQMAAHQAPQSLGFSRQEHWSGLPFPSPMHESEKWKWSRSVSVRLFVTPWTTAHQAPPSMGFSRQEYWSGVPLPSSK